MVSCRQKQVPSGSAVPYVARILGTPSSGEYTNLMAADGSNVSGAIAIIGSPLACIRLSEKFLTGDDFDNIDGRTAPDGLPDFAGETFISYIDGANAPYEGYVSSNNTLMLREIAVRNFLHALDTLASGSIFPDEERTPKPRAKMIVFASPLMKEYASQDIDTLLHVSGRDIPVVWAEEDPGAPEDSLGTAASSVAARCYKIMRQRNSFTHNIAWPKAEGFVSMPVYGLATECYAEGGYFSEDFKYSRINNNKIDTYTFIRYSDEYMSEDFLHTIRTKALKTYREYVQD